MHQLAPGDSTVRMSNSSKGHCTHKQIPQAIIGLFAHPCMAPVSTHCSSVWILHAFFRPTLAKAKRQLVPARGGENVSKGKAWINMGLQVPPIERAFIKWYAASRFHSAGGKTQENVSDPVVRPPAEACSRNSLAQQARGEQALGSNLKCI